MLEPESAQPVSTQADPRPTEPGPRQPETAALGCSPWTHRGGSPRPRSRGCDRKFPSSQRESQWTLRWYERRRLRNRTAACGAEAQRWMQIIPLHSNVAGQSLAVVQVRRQMPPEHAGLSDDLALGQSLAPAHIGEQ